MNHDIPLTHMDTLIYMRARAVQQVFQSTSLGEKKSHPLSDLMIYLVGMERIFRPSRTTDIVADSGFLPDITHADQHKIQQCRISP